MLMQQRCSVCYTGPLYLVTLMDLTKPKGPCLLPNGLGAPPKIVSNATRSNSAGTSTSDALVQSFKSHTGRLGATCRMPHIHAEPEPRTRAQSLGDLSKKPQKSAQHATSVVTLWHLSRELWNEHCIAACSAHSSNGDSEGGSLLLANGARVKWHRDGVVAGNGQVLQVCNALRRQDGGSRQCVAHGLQVRGGGWGAGAGQAGIGASI